jgi:hypothetical protein
MGINSWNTGCDGDVAVKKVYPSLLIGVQSSTLERGDLMTIESWSLFWPRRSP